MQINRLSGQKILNSSAKARTERPLGSLLCAGAMSLVLHAGVAQLGGVDIIGGITNLFSRQTTAQQKTITKDDSGGDGRGDDIGSIRERKLQALREEKTNYVNNLFSDLVNGRSISLFDFFVRSTVLERNIRSLESSELELVEENDLRIKLSSIITMIEQQTNGIVDPGRVVDKSHEAMHKRLLRGYSINSQDLFDVINDGIYKCDTATELMTLLMDRKVNSDYFGMILLDPPKDPKVGTAGHILNWYRDKNALSQIENTNGGIPQRRPFIKGLRVPKEMYVVAYLVNNGIEISQLPKKYSAYYKHGIGSGGMHGMGSGGMPKAGVSHSLPDPPDKIIPNPYYMNDKEEIVKNAKLSAAALDLLLNQPIAVDPYTSASIMRLYRGIDWCKEAYWEADPTSDKDRFYFEDNGFDYRRKFSRYKLAIMAADFMRKSGDTSYERCIPANEFRVFREQAEAILSRKKDDWGKMQKKSLADVHKAREYLLKIYNLNGLQKETRISAYYLLALMHSPDDYPIFRDELVSPENQLLASTTTGEIVYISWKMKYAITFLGFMNGARAEEAASLLLNALKAWPVKISGNAKANESQQFLTGILLYNLAKLGKLQDVIMYYQAHSHELAFNKEDVLGGILEFLERPEELADKVDVIENIIKNPSEDITARVYWIAVLAKAGKMKEALEYLEKYQVFGAIVGDRHKTKTEHDIIMALGNIRSLQIRDFLIKIFKRWPGLAVDIGDVFHKNGYYSEELIAAIKKILDDPNEDSVRREYAAFVLIQFGKL